VTGGLTVRVALVWGGWQAWGKYRVAQILGDNHIVARRLGEGDICVATGVDGDGLAIDIAVDQEPHESARSSARTRDVGGVLAGGAEVENVARRRCYGRGGRAETEGKGGGGLGGGKRAGEEVVAEVNGGDGVRAGRLGNQDLCGIAVQKHRACEIRTVDHELNKAVWRSQVRGNRGGERGRLAGGNGGNRGRDGGGSDRFTDIERSADLCACQRGGKGGVAGVLRGDDVAAGRLENILLGNAVCANAKRVAIGYAIDEELHLTRDGGSVGGSDGGGEDDRIAQGG